MELELGTLLNYILTSDLFGYVVVTALLIIAKRAFNQYLAYEREGKIPAVLQSIVIEVEKQWRDNPMLHKTFHDKKEMAIELAQEALDARGIKINVDELAGKIEASWALTFNGGLLEPKEKKDVKPLNMYSFDPDKAN